MQEQDDPQKIIGAIGTLDAMARSAILTELTGVMLSNGFDEADLPYIEELHRHEIPKNFKDLQKALKENPELIGPFCEHLPQAIQQYASKKIEAAYEYVEKGKMIKQKAQDAPYKESYAGGKLYEDLNLLDSAHQELDALLASDIYQLKIQR